MTRRDWRSDAAYSDLEDAPLRDFAWEYLRRNPNYMEDYARNDSGAEADEAARYWGLRFRGRSQQRRPRSRGALATGGRSRHRRLVRLAAGLGLATAAAVVGCWIIADVR